MSSHPGRCTRHAHKCCAPAARVTCPAHARIGLQVTIDVEPRPGRAAFTRRILRSSVLAFPSYPTCVRSSGHFPRLGRLPVLLACRSAGSATLWEASPHDPDEAKDRAANQSMGKGLLSGHSSAGSHQHADPYLHALSAQASLIHDAVGTHDQCGERCRCLESAVESGQRFITPARTVCRA
jgi:hypothetical protein